MVHRHDDTSDGTAAALAERTGPTVSATADVAVVCGGLETDGVDCVVAGDSDSEQLELELGHWRGTVRGRNVRVAAE